ncbi:MAG: FkbM family methyltransferase [Pseudomonadota bacterium]
MSDEVAAFGTYALSPGMERLRRFGQGLGRGVVARRACSVIRRVVTGGRPGPFDVEPFPGQRARLYPGDNLSEKRVFGGAQFWDWAERAALGRAVRAADEPVYVIDAGANAGLYTLAVRAEAAGRDVRIIAIEPDPENLSRLRFNVAASDAGDDVTVAPVALSDAPGEIRIAASHANRGELAIDADGVPVSARPLLDVVTEAGYPRIDALKIDIEGMEERVLGHFFSNAPRALWPGMVILEARRGEETPALQHLRSLGYDVEERTRMNVVARAPAPAANPASNTGDAHGKA